MRNATVKKLQNELEKGSALLIASVPNRFYITGFETSDGYVLITDSKAYFLIDFRYVEKAKEIVSSCEVHLSSSPFKEIKELCEENGIKRLYVENEYVSMSLLRQLSENVQVEIPECDRFDTLLRDLRAVKNEKELSLMKEAQRLTDETFKYITARIEEGRTEREIMLDMEFYMRRLGSEGVSFDFIVVSGKNSSLPHGVPTDKKVVCRDVDKISRDIIYSAGYEGCFGHGLGHSVGIEIHERPLFNTRCDTVLKAGTVMTVEPGIYIENKYGVRIEDMVYVTENGCIDLTNSPKELICL